MKKFVSVLVIAFAVILGVLVAGPFYVINEGEQAVVVRLGRIVDVVTESGLKLKTPFIDNVFRYPKRIMAWDGGTREMLSAESQQLLVDVVARWRISDPQVFFQVVKSIDTAQAQLSRIINGQVPNVVAANPLNEMVRSTDLIINQQLSASAAIGMDPSENIDESIIATIVQPENQQGPIRLGRQQLSRQMLTRVQTEVPRLGIEVIDVVIRQVRYNSEITQSVYTRMERERDQIAEGIRSAGNGEKARWEGRTEQERMQIISAAYEQAEVIKGVADAEAARIYAEAYNRNPGFFNFWRAIESYRSTMPGLSSTLSTDMDYFRHLFSPD